MTQEKRARNRVIYKRWKEGKSIKQLADIYEMSRIAIFKIIQRWEKRKRIKEYLDNGGDPELL